MKTNQKSYKFKKQILSRKKHFIKHNPYNIKILKLFNQKIKKRYKNIK